MIIKTSLFYLIGSYFPHGGLVSKRSCNFQLVLGGAFKRSTNCSWVLSSSTKTRRSRSTDSASRQAVSNIKSERFLPSAAAARSMRSRWRCRARMLMLTVLIELLRVDLSAFIGTTIPSCVCHVNAILCRGDFASCHRRCRLRIAMASAGDNISFFPLATFTIPNSVSSHSRKPSTSLSGSNSRFKCRRSFRKPLNSGSDIERSSEFVR